MQSKNIYEMLEYAALSYKDVQPEEDGCNTIYIDDMGTGIECYMRIYKKTVVISFRGTNSTKDLLTDIRFWKKEIPYDNNRTKIRVHSGFIDAYKSPNVRSEIMNYIPNDTYCIKITGHSYGAALAVLCAIDLEYNFPDKDYEVYLFGCPRIGNRAFSKSYNNRIIKTVRVENGNDMVTKIPPAIFGYRHVGIKVHIGRHRIMGAYSLKNHNIRQYFEKMFKMCCSDF